MKYRIWGTHPDAYDYPMGWTNNFLFGDLGSEEAGYSIDFDTKEIAEQALEHLNTTGDFEGCWPLYWIEEAPETAV